VQIAAVQLRVPKLPDLAARAGLEAEDLLIKSEMLARGGTRPRIRAPGPAQSRLVRPNRRVGGGAADGSRPERGR